jgi:hypothetical protein
LGGAFFFSSWAFGQYMRINKQQRVEDEFQTVKGELQRLLKSLEDQTTYLIGHTTGGDSIGYFMPMVYAGSSQIQFYVFERFRISLFLTWTQNGSTSTNRLTLQMASFGLGIASFWVRYTRTRRHQVCLRSIAGFYLRTFSVQWMH